MDAYKIQEHQYDVIVVGAGGPGLRPQYHADYFGAFVIGPDGHNFEAVCHVPPD